MGDINNTEKKFSVYDSVWIAAALMSAEVFNNNQKANKEQYYFKQADIIKRAQIYAYGNVQSARVSSWTCADATDNIYNYLRGDNKENKSLRRLSMADEFNGNKTVPTDLDADDDIPYFSMNGHGFSLKQLFDFVINKYPLCIATEETEDDDNFYPLLD